MTILILEDEQAAAQRLIQLLKETEPEAIIAGVLESVREAIKWLENNKEPDIILSDIQLADGISLEVFRQAGVTTPVIFTTAYNEYTLNAFKLNSIDYLLKPIDKDELKAAFQKYRKLHKKNELADPNLLTLFQRIATGKSNFKSRFLIKQGERLITIPIEDVAYVKADDKVVFLHVKKGAKYIIDEPLDDLETLLDPAVFFRINRTYLTPLDSIDKIYNHFNGRLKITLHHSDDPDIFVSRARVAEFKKWLGK